MGEPREKPPEPIRGFGDVVAKITKAFGVEPCAPCDARRRKLNEILPNPFRGDRKKKP